MVILITGKKDSGKTHYARLLKQELLAEDYQVKWLDGDVFRKETGNKDYSEEGRKRNLTNAAMIAAEYEAKGYIVLVSLIAPYKKFRDKMRSYWEESRIVYIPGGTLWEGTRYEIPNNREMEVKHNFK